MLDSDALGERIGLLEDVGLIGVATFDARVAGD
jgi:hypothetical protein